MLTTLIITRGHKIECQGGRETAPGWWEASSSEELHFLPLCLRDLLGWSVSYKYTACGCWQILNKLAKGPSLGDSWWGSALPTQNGHSFQVHGNPVLTMTLS